MTRVASNIQSSSRLNSGGCRRVLKPLLTDELITGSTKTWNPESGNGTGIMEMETETEYGIHERRLQAIDL